MTTNRNPRTTTAPAAYTAVQLAYIQSALARAEKILWKDPWCDEICSDVGLRLTNDVVGIMNAYPSPHVWVNVVVKTIRIDVMRRNNAQRGAGARNQRHVGELNDMAINEYELHQGFTAPADSRLGEVVHPMDLIPQATLVRLTDKQATLFRLRELDGLTTAEAADHVGTTPNNASRLIAGAKRTLREDLGDA